ncbi:phasin family protein [Alkalicoccus chagannorensis]|uniref:phasin family protein n=1 Tax=Alkalicoccus chagannorensis TaxID=427072 RepID=UPI00041FBFFC|nr:hypothetical protein [Alkalicoccus chagannorensis]
MNNLIKTGFLLGLGAAVSSKEKVDRYIDDLLAKGKVTPDEADELYHSLLKKGEETETEWNSRMKRRLQEMLQQEADMVTKEEHDALKSRVEALEARLDDQQKRPPEDQ